MTQQTETQTPPTIALVQKFYACFASGDLDTLRNEVLAPDVTWLIPGHHPLAGLKRGPDEIVAYFTTIAQANFKAEVISLSHSGEYVVDVHRGWGAYGNATIDMHWVLSYRIQDGKIAAVENFALDQHAADMFFWTVWGDKLKPVPDRLIGA